MTELMFEFRKGHVRDQWRGRWLRGIELNEARLNAADVQRHQFQKRLEGADPHRAPSSRLLAAWEPVEREIRNAVDDSTWRLQLAELHPHSLIAGVWKLACPAQKRGWIEARFGWLIRSCAGKPCEFIVCGGVA